MNRFEDAFPPRKCRLYRKFQQKISPSVITSEANYYSTLMEKRVAKKRAPSPSSLDPSGEQ